MKNKNYHTAGTDPNSNRKIIETETIQLTLAHMAAHFPDFNESILYQELSFLLR